MFKIPKPTLRSMGAGKRRVRYPVFDRSLRLLSAVLVSVMLGSIVTPYYSLVAQPTVPTLPTPDFKATDFNPYLDRANSGRSQTGWESIIASGRLTLRTQWESLVDTTLDRIVSDVTESDSIIGNADYKKFVRESLESQKKTAIANWELKADQLIRSNRAEFSTELARLNLDNSKDDTDDSVKNVLNKSETDCVNCDENLKVRKENQALDYASFVFDSAKEQIDLSRLTWEKSMSDQTEQGLYQFQQARLALDKNHIKFNSALNETDQNFQKNITKFEEYEQKVRDKILDTVTNPQTGLEAYLHSNGLFKTRSCNSHQNNNNSTECIPGKTLNASGQKFATLLSQIKNGATAKVPISQLVKQMKDYMETMKADSIAERDRWNSMSTGTSVFGGRTFNRNPGGKYWKTTRKTWGIGNSGAGQPPKNAPVWWSDSYQLTGNDATTKKMLKSYVSYIDGRNSGNANNSHIEAMLKLQGKNLKVESVSKYGLCGGTGGGNGGTHTCYSSQGMGAFSYTTTKKSGNALTGHKYKHYIDEEQKFDIDLTYKWTDENAVANTNTWQKYVDNLSTNLDKWTNDIYPAIKNWEKQVVDYKDQYTQWKVDATKQRQEAKDKYITARTNLTNEQNTWMNEMQKARTAGRNRFNAISQALEVKRSKEIDGTREHFNTENMTREKLNELINSIVQDVSDSVPGELPGAPDLPKADIIAAAGMVEAKAEFLNASQENLPDPNQLQRVAAAFQQSLTGMMNLTLAKTLSGKALDAREGAITRNRKILEGSGFVVSQTDDGTLTAVRSIPNGYAKEHEGVDGTEEEHYYPDTDEQEVIVNPPTATKLAETGDLFSSWDTKEILSDFSENIKESSENAAIGDASTLVKMANDEAKGNLVNYEKDRKEKIRDAKESAMWDQVSSYVKIGLAVLSVVPGVGQFAMAALVLVSVAEGYAEGGLLGAVTGGVSGVVGAFTQKLGVDLEFGYTYEDGFAGSVGVGFKGLSAGVDFDESGVNGFNAGVDIKGVNAGISYDADEGWGAELGVSKGGFDLGLSYNEQDGFGADVGYSKGGLDLGLSYNESDGFGLEAGYSKGGFDLGVSYDQNGGFGVEAGYSKGGLDLGLSYSQNDGFATEVGFEQGGASLSLGYSEADGFNTELGYSGNGLDVSLGYSQADGFATEVAYENGGLSLGLGYSQADGFETEVAYQADGVDVALGYSEQNGVSADANLSRDGVDLGLSYNEQDGFGTELAVSKNGAELNLAYSDSDGFNAGASYEKDGVSLDVGYNSADGFSAGAGFEKDGVTLGLAYNGADGFSGNAAYEKDGLTVAAGYGADGFTADASYEKNGFTVGLGYAGESGATASLGYKDASASLSYKDGGVSGDIDFGQDDFSSALAMNADNAPKGESLDLGSVDLGGLRKAMESKKTAFMDQMKEKVKTVQKDKKQELKSKMQDLIQLK